MSNAIEVRGLCKTYRDFELDHLDLTVPTGCIVGLVGENGAGKTTTLKAILNTIHPDNGTIQVLGSSSSDPAVHSRIGVVFEDSFFYETLTPAEVGRILAGMQPKWDMNEYTRLIERFHLPAKKPIKEMSRGMRMKFRLAAALGHHPDLLILDEPSSGLDPVMRGEFLDLLQQFILDGQHSVLFSSHITSDIEKVADIVAYLHQGRLVFQLEKDELLERYGLLRCAAAQMDTLPSELIVTRRQSSFSCEALVQFPDKVRKLLPNAVIDRVSIDEIMQFISGRDEQ